MSEKKAYNTKQRDEILLAARSFGDKHFTAAELMTRLSLEGKSVGFATVYRAIDKMVEDGKLRKFFVDSASAACYQNAFDASHECTDHFHLKCSECGKLYHVDCSHISELGAHIKSEHGFEIDNSKTVFYGICEECRKRKSKK